MFISHLIPLMTVLIFLAAPPAAAQNESPATEETPPPSPTLTPSAEALFILKNEDFSLEEKREMLQNLANQNPGAADAWTAYGEVLESLGEDETALQAFEKAVEIDPSAYTPWSWIGILAKRGTPDPDLERAERALRRALAEGAPRAKTLNELGVTLAIEGEFEEALKVFQSAINEDPQWGVLYGNLMKAVVRTGETEVGWDYIDRAINAERFDISSVLAFTDYVAASGNPEATLPVYEKALEQHKDLPRLHYYYGLALAAAGQQEKAINELRRAQQLSQGKEQHAEIVQAAEFDIFRMQHPRDERKFQKARQLVFNQESSGNRLEKKLEEAVETLDPLIEKHPEFWNGYFVRGVAYRRLDQREKAREDLNKVLEIFADEPNATMQLALMARDDYDFQMAAELADRAVELAPRDPTFLMNAGLIMIEAGKCDEAWEYYRQVVRMMGEKNAAVLKDELDARCAEGEGQEKE